MRLFLALWPDAAVAAALHARGRTLHAACGGRPMRRDTLHLTLAFIGDVAEEAVGRVEAAASRVRAAPFDLALDRVGAWHGNRVLRTGASDVPAALGTLAEGLSTELRAAGFALEDRPFSPHVTLVRNAERAPEAGQVPPLHWRAEDFVLVISERLPSGARYRVLRRWPLGGATLAAAARP